MRRLLNIYLTIILFLISSSCASIFKGNLKNQSNTISLQLSEETDLLHVYNEYVKMYFEYTDIVSLLKKNNLDKGVNVPLYSIKSSNTAILLENNLMLKSLEQEIVFPLAWQLLKEGKAKIFYNKHGKFINEIEFVRFKDFSGEQECYKIKGGDIFLSKIISLGE